MTRFGIFVDRLVWWKLSIHLSLTVIETLYHILIITFYGHFEEELSFDTDVSGLSKSESLQSKCSKYHSAPSRSS